MVELLVGYAVGVILWTGGLVVALYLYERRLLDERPLNRPEKLLYVLGILSDVSYNHVVLTVVFLELPAHCRETASQRFLRHRDHPGYRGMMARLCWRVFIQPAAPNHELTMQRKYPHED